MCAWIRLTTCVSQALRALCRIVDFYLDKTRSHYALSVFIGRICFERESSRPAVSDFSSPLALRKITHAPAIDSPEATWRGALQSAVQLLYRFLCMRGRCFAFGGIGDLSALCAPGHERAQSTGEAFFGALECHLRGEACAQINANKKWSCINGV